MVYGPSLGSAVEFSQVNRLEEWVHFFLCAEGNNRALSDGLRLVPRFFLGPVVVPLGGLVRCTGPEPGMRFRVEVQAFESRVLGLQRALESGADLPPLIVECQGGQWTVNDGNHRLEALQRLGRKTVSVIFWTSSSGEMEELKIRI